VARQWAVVIVCAAGGCSLIDPLDGLSDDFGKHDGGSGDAGGEDGGGADANGVGDADADADAEPLPSCDLRKEFGTPTSLDSVNSTEFQGSARFTPDEHTLYIDGVRDGGDGGNASFDLFVTTRPDLTDDFGPISRLVPPSTSTMQEYSGSVTEDNLVLFFEQQPIGGSDSKILWTRRAKATDPFGVPSWVPGVNTSGSYEGNPFVRGDGSELWFVATGVAASIDIFVAHASAGTYQAAPVNEVNTPDAEFTPVISADGLTLYFASDRALPGRLGMNIWYATRRKAGEFKAKCLELMDEVAMSGGTIVITKRGKAVARLVPMEDQAAPLLGFYKDKMEIVGDIVAPLDVDWGPREPDIRTVRRRTPRK
jgi:prevent-host-death family protein